MAIDRKKLQHDIMEAVSAAAQRFMDASSDAQRQKAAGAVNGLADMLDDLYSGLSDDELEAMFQGDIMQYRLLADEATTAEGVRYNTAAANEISTMGLVMDTWNEVVDAKAGYDAAMDRKGTGSLAEGLGKAFADSGVPTTATATDADDGAPGLKPAEAVHKKYGRRAPRVSADDILVWLLCRSENGQDTVPIDDIAIEFYLRGDRSDTEAHKAALNAMYSLEKRGYVETQRHSGGKNGKAVVDSVSITTHGAFEASRIRGPVASNQTKSEDELLKEFGHLKEEVGDV